MSAKRDKYVKGRRGPVSGSLINRKEHSSKKNAVRKTRKRRDIVESGGKRHVDKSPRH